MLLRYAQNVLTMAWYLAVVLIIYTGWTVRDQRYLVSGSGIGYWLGILGGSMMLMLLFYPVRKRKPRWKYSGSVKFWFRFHMFLGIAGPVLIILHTGYHLGSLNGAVAFFCMLIVAGSGLVGRYLYRRIHHGLYGEKIKFEELYHKDESWEERLTELKQKYPDLVQRLEQYESMLVQRGAQAKRSLWFYKTMQWKLGSLNRQIARSLGRSDDTRSFRKRIANLKSITNLGVNEILFSYWHILHFPLFIMLVIAGITHVVVVHFY